MACILFPSESTGSTTRAMSSGAVLGYVEVWNPAAWVCIMTHQSLSSSPVCTSVSSTTTIIITSWGFCFNWLSEGQIPLSNLPSSLNHQRGACFYWGMHPTCGYQSFHTWDAPSNAQNLPKTLPQWLCFYLSRLHISGCRVGRALQFPSSRHSHRLGGSELLGLLRPWGPYS